MARFTTEHDKATEATLVRDKGTYIGHAAPYDSETFYAARYESYRCSHVTIGTDYRTLDAALSAVKAGGD